MDAGWQHNGNSHRFGLPEFLFFLFLFFLFFYLIFFVNEKKCFRVGRIEYGWSGYPNYTLFFFGLSSKWVKCNDYFALCAWIVMLDHLVKQL
jgi:hypothetical protein